VQFITRGSAAAVHRTCLFRVKGEGLGAGAELVPAAIAQYFIAPAGAL